MSEVDVPEAHGYRRPDRSGDARAMIELAERQMDRLDAVGWHFALKLAAAVTVVAQVVHEFMTLWANGIVGLNLVQFAAFSAIFSPLAWRLYRDHAARVRSERRTLSQAVLAAHELLPLTTHLSPMEQQELRLRLSRLPFDDAKTADIRASSAPADDTPAPVRPTSPSAAH